MKKDWTLYANHILDCLEKIKQIKARGDVIHDSILYDAALRNLQTLSEASRFLPEEKKLQYPEIEWKNISGFRNILVHEYLGEIDPYTVQKVIDTHLSALESAIIKMLANA